MTRKGFFGWEEGPPRKLGPKPFIPAQNDGVIRQPQTESPSFQVVSDYSLGSLTRKMHKQIEEYFEKHRR